MALNPGDSVSWPTILLTLSSRLMNRKMLVALFTLPTLELFQHLPSEVAVVWESRWNFGKCAYLVLRYVPIAFMAVWLYYNSAPEFTPFQTCKILFNIAGAMMILTCLCADAILYLRVYSLSMKSKAMKAFLIFNYVVSASCAIFLIKWGMEVFRLWALQLVSIICIIGTGFHLHYQTFIQSPHLLPDINCFDFDSPFSPPWLATIFGVLLYSSAFTTGLSIWYGVKLYLSMWPLPPGFVLLKIFYLDGAFYFAAITAISIANITVALVAPTRYRHLLPIPQTITHSILAARMILHLREVARVSLIEQAYSRNESQRMTWGASLSLSAFNAVVPEEDTSVEGVDNI